MQKNYMTYGSAAKLSFGISVVLHLFFILNHYLRNIFLPTSGGEAPPIKAFIVMMLFGFISIFILLFLLFVLNFRLLKTDLPQKKKITAIIVGSVLLTVVYSTLMLAIQVVMMPIPPGSAPPMAKWVGLIRDVFLAVIVIFISQILYLTQKKQQAELRNEALEAENIRTRYESLKNQINPHFLFNTLSTLDSLVEIDPVRSREYIQKLSSVFRYTLKSNDVVTLKEELAFVQDYSDLMQIRHGNNLQIRFNTDKHYNEYQVVPLAVQGLVENAIKHNALSDSQPLIITIETSGAGMLIVSNSYQPRECPEYGEGVGLANLTERYRLKWQKEISIKNFNGVFLVSLPLIPPIQQ